MKKCAVIDSKGNHCPETPTHEIDKGVWICDKCYNSVMMGAWGRIKVSDINSEIKIIVIKDL